MKIEALKKLPQMNVPDEIISLAATDAPKLKSDYWGKKRNIYKHKAYAYCVDCDGILKVALFTPESVRLGAQQPIYEIFLDYNHRQFITYDLAAKKWRDAMIYNLPNLYGWNGEKLWFGKESNNLITNCLTVSQDGAQGIMEFQMAIRKENLERCRKRETDPWDKELEVVPELPKDWLRFCRRTVITDHFIFYKYKKSGTTEGHCSRCESIVSISKPKHNKYGICPKCKKRHQYKAIGKAGAIHTEDQPAYLLQRCKGGFILREFRVRSSYKKGEFDTSGIYSSEVRRVIYGENSSISTYYYGLYKNVTMRWIKGKNLQYCNSPIPGAVYPYTLCSLAERELGRTGLPELIAGIERIDPEVYLLKLQSAPYIEQLSKAGLTRLASEIVHKDVFGEIEVRNADNLAKRLGINNLELRRLRSNNGGKRFLEWLRYERNAGRIVPDEAINWFCENSIEPSMIAFMRNRMSDLQICNYLKRQLVGSQKSAREMISTWTDYLSMANRMKMNVNDAIVYKAKKLEQRHDEIVQMFGSKELAILAGEIAEKYPDVDKFCESLKPKYEFGDEQFAIVAPTCIEDIISDGRTLHHCGGKSERYYDRIQNMEAFVLFLRRTETPDKPWYTLEVEPGGTIRQKRTEYDRQKDDLEEAKPFLEKWQSVVAERLDAEDTALAAEAKKLRNLGFQELREQQVRIRGTDYVGQLLADVLEADLMESVGSRRSDP